jgi:flagellar basal-body rod protein FlgB
MALMQLPVFTALTEKMRWHQNRQSLLAENVANAETPGYRGRDLAAFAFKEHMSNLSVPQIATTTTNSAHVEAMGTQADGFGTRKLNSFEITPEGNGVTLEDEMMKVASNQMDYQAATTLYTRSLKILRTALGRSA